MIQRIFSNKKFLAGLVILILIIVSVMAYIVVNIQKNVAAMQSVTSTSYFPDYPALDTKNKKIDLIKRGEYLAKAGDCIACHTNTLEKGKTFAGGLPMQTPFGTIYSPNITPNKETGIGGWTDKQFIKAVREGIAPDGQYYYPAFPYYYFNKISTDDLLAIKAYLDSIPAVYQENRENTMIFPFNWRFLQLGWRVLFFMSHKTGPYKIVPHQSSQWNRGAYLVQGLGHCGMCHTPSYNLLSESLPLAAPIEKYDLIGAKVQGFLAPNITKGNLGSISDAEVDDVFMKDELIGGGKVEGPMLEVNRDSLHYLTPEDRLAIITYLKTVQSKTPPKPKGSVGKVIYEGYCSGCHASGAGGAPKYGDANNWDPILSKGMSVIYHNAIHGIGGMPAKGTCISCSDGDIQQAVDYMIESVKGKKARPASETKKLTLVDGKRIYEENCSVCHAVGFKGAPKPGDKSAWIPIIHRGFLHTYLDVLTGDRGHIPRGACPTCTDDELLVAVKYMMQESATNNDYTLW